ncbi:FRG domain-containing protein [Vibrio alginolyticus]|uniref:FRG domain-containing protein n=1 Tax=Vibrio alginolyticus TaxID=663 RepID=UPI0023D820D2|nr:FRG domain-containing protein [Vibrio alginolyticus]WEK79845.1 FRG domain-containing protein [Vibrio alginolyticus]
MKVKSVIQFLQSIDSNHAEQVYRGQAREEWLLLPSIARVNTDNLPSQYQDGWRGVERDLLNRFKKHAVRFMNREPQSKIDWMIQAQHHGVPTRLLDWSTSPLKSLYFAVENSHHDDSDGVVFVFFPRAWRTSPQDVNGEEELVLTAFHPYFINERVAAQDGCFTLFPFPQKNELNSFSAMQEGFSPQNDVISMQKIIIDKDSKSIIRDELESLGITDVAMFPDLDGVAKGIRRAFGCV